MKKLLVFDGNSIINRAFYAIHALTNKNGEPTNAVFGFLKLYFKYLEMSSPDMVAVAFDLRGGTFRNELYSEYKAGRHAMPDDLAVQFEPLKAILRAMNVKIYECKGFEADDIIGTLADYCTKNQMLCDIVSGDRDDFQLVNDFVRVIMPVTKKDGSDVEIYTPEKIVEKYGFGAERLIDLKAIMGDSSDNIKGVSGIGEKGAQSLILEFETLDNIYANIDSDKIKPAMRQKLIDGKDSAYLSKKLAEIVKNVPIEIGGMDIQPFDTAALLPLLERYELTSIIKNLDLKQNKKEIQPGDTIDAKKHRDWFLQNGLCFVYQNGEFVVKGPNGVCPAVNVLPLLTDAQIEKITYAPKELYKVLLNDNKDIQPFYDIEVAQYVIDPSRQVADTDSVFQLVDSLESIKTEQLETIEKNNQQKLLFEVEFPLTVCLADMERLGFTVDKSEIERYSKKLQNNIEQLEERIYFHAGEQFNINSPKQLGVVLFEKLMLPHGKKTKTGYSTGADILEKLRTKHPIVEDILEYRQYVKLKSTYCDGLLKLVTDQSKIHTSFKQTVTQTGRLSSAEPNLQNIPVRTTLGRELRAMFVPSGDNILIDADYSQIELRVLAHIANDSAMIGAFANDADIHTVTAASVFGVPTDFVTPEMRRAAKAVNFGIVYGISDFSLAQDINTTKAQAKKYIDSYLDLYSGVRRYMTDVVQKARQDGFTTTLLNRRRYLPELKASNFLTRSFGERAALNTPIQGTAADIIKIAMVNTRRALIENNLSAKLIMQVHDELIIEAPENEKDTVIQILTNEMENAMNLSVRLKADVLWGRSWYECK